MNKSLKTELAKYTKNILVLFSAFVLLMSCQFRQTAREVRTLANLQNLAHNLLILDKGKVGASVSVRDFSAEVENFFEDGRDPWGNLIIFIPADVSGGSTFLLVSAGSDGRLDHESIQYYFGKDRESYLPIEELKAESGRDIVIYGREVVTCGAHK